MEAAIDLHIHSVLSPCADNDMTPNNIVNMAFLKGLDVIAVTDHNTAENCEAVMKCGQNRGIAVIPGMELETMEEVHMICLFPNLESALKMQDIVYNALPGLKNREDIFGQQITMDEEDRVVGSLDRLLVTAAGISLDEAYHYVSDLNGVTIPAHLDRASFSILSNLGSVPENLVFKYLEISRTCRIEEFLHAHPELADCRFLRSSDAHQLGSILERETFLKVGNPTLPEIIQALKV